MAHEYSTPIITKIKLPGQTDPYFIADAELREYVETLSEQIAGGVSFIIAWDGSGEPDYSKIPDTAAISYNGEEHYGTLAPSSADPGCFYLVRSTNTAGAPTDIYDEYVTFGPERNKSWEKIGSTQVNLTDVVTNVVLNKSTSNAIGANSTFDVTQPTIQVEEVSSGGDIELTKDISTNQGYIEASTGRTADVEVEISPQSINISTDYTAQTSSFIKQITPTTYELVTDETYSMSGDTTPASLVEEDASTSFLASIASVDNGVLSFDEVSIPKYIISGVNVPVLGSQIRYATGQLGSDSHGATILAGVQSTADDAVIGITPGNTRQVLGDSSSVTVTQQPDFSTSLKNTDTANPDAATAITGVHANTTYVRASASGGRVDWNNKDTVEALNNSTDITVTKGTP